MGVAPEAIAKNFGYRLKKMNKHILYTSSHVICQLLLPLQWILLLMPQAPESKTRWTCASLTNISYSLLLSLAVLFSLSLFLMHLFPWYIDLSVIVCSGQHIRSCKYIVDLYPCKGPLYVLINKAYLAMGKNPNPVISFSTASSSSS
jgi:hypothetical protein